MIESGPQPTPRELVERILAGPGQAPHDLRVRAFNNKDVPAPLAGLIDNVVTRPAEIIDADFIAVTGFDDDEPFELVVCAADGQANRQYEAGLAALTQATDGQGGS